VAGVIEYQLGFAVQAFVQQSQLVDGLVHVHSLGVGQKYCILGGHSQSFNGVLLKADGVVHGKIHIHLAAKPWLE